MPSLAMRVLVLVCLITTSAARAGAQTGPATAAEAAAVDRIFAHFDRSDSPGCIVGVGRAGGTVYRNGFGMANLEHDVPLTPYMISEIGSVSKQFTAAAVVLLARDGKLSLDDDVRKHYPEFPDFGRRVTIRHLLNHTSGLRDQFGLLDLAGQPNGTAVSTVDRVVELALAQRTLNFEPNSEYLYSNTGYTFLNALVQRVSGRTFAEFTTERIFEPLGMHDTQWRDDFTRVVRGRVLAYSPDGRGGFRQEMPFSNLHGSGGLLTTVEDLITWTEALHGDRVGGGGVFAEMTRPGVLENGTALSYALGLRVDDYRGVREVGHGGSTAGYRAHLVHYPDTRLTVALQCNVASANAGSLAREVAAVFLGDRLRAAPPAPVAVILPQGELESRAGLYYNARTHQVVRLAARDGRLAGGGLELVPTGRTRFTTAGGGSEYTYVPAEGGRPAELRLASGEEGGGDALVSMAPANPTPAQLQALAGTYHNAELDATVTVAAEDGRLVLRYRPGRVVRFEAAFADAFTAGGTTLVFHRDAAGAPVAFAYHAGRVRGIRFDRR